MACVKLVEEIKDQAHLDRRLIELSASRGGAWSYSVMPFTHEVHFFMAASPAKLPDYLIESSRGRVAYKGKMVSFSRAAIYREQQRGMNCDR